MENIKEKLYEPALNELGFYRDTTIESKEGSSWIHFTSSELGQGYYRFYIDSNLFAVSVWDFTPKDDFIHDFNQTDCISVGCYDAVEGMVLKPIQRTLGVGSNFGHHIRAFCNNTVIIDYIG